MDISKDDSERQLEILNEGKLSGTDLVLFKVKEFLRKSSRENSVMDVTMIGMTAVSILLVFIAFNHLIDIYRLSNYPEFYMLGNMFNVNF